LTFCSSEVLNLFFLIYINLLPPPRLTQNAKFAHFTELLPMELGGGSNLRPKNLKRDGKAKLEVEFPVLHKSIPLKKIYNKLHVPFRAVKNSMELIGVIDTPNQSSYTPPEDRYRNM